MVSTGGRFAAREPALETWLRPCDLDKNFGGLHGELSVRFRQARQSLHRRTVSENGSNIPSSGD
jgi:hypothetical protein